MYSSYEFYQNEHKGKLSEDDFETYGKVATRVLDKLTHKRLITAFPEDADNVYHCECELIDYEASVSMARGGKQIRSMSSGSESITYDTTLYEDAAKNEASHMQGALNICRLWLGGEPDANGVNLLYSGF